MWWYRNILFFLFTALAAPLEFHIHWFLGLTKRGRPFVEAINEPLVSGTLFFYSVIVVVEAFMRLETHPADLKRPGTLALKILCGLLFLPFLGFLTNVDSPLRGRWIHFQWGTALLSFFVAIIVHLYISKVDALLKAA
jgi:hypothetical protein